MRLDQLRLFVICLVVLLLCVQVRCGDAGAFLKIKDIFGSMGRAFTTDPIEDDKLALTFLGSFIDNLSAYQTPAI